MSRLAKKRQKILRDERERTRDAALGLARKERDHQCFEANRDFAKTMEEARTTLAAARKKAWDDYDERRKLIYKMEAE